jgi:hypothetical protein
MTIAGDYKLDGNRINLDFTLITAKATDPRNQKEADQAVVALKTAMKPERDPIEWVADNEVVITQGTGPTHKATLKRKT